ncbi:MAG: DUF975 family protein [Butyrivibrio sp.]|nr:DUF975 family protein [Butyrivibrio sp.]
MNSYKSSSQLKAIAKEKLLGQYSTTIGAFLLYGAITLVLDMVVSFMVNPTDIYTLVIYEVAVFIIELLLGIIISGRAYMYMNVVYSQPANITDLFYGFQSHPNKAIGIQLFYSVAALLVNLPFTIYINFFAYSQSTTGTFVCFLIGAIGILINIYVSLAISQAFYLLQDFPDRSVKNLILTSCKLMKGNKFRLFYIYVSFIPLMLLCIITFFVPFLWVNSYMEATFAAFYQDLIAVSSSKNTAAN